MMIPRDLRRSRPMLFLSSSSASDTVVPSGYNQSKYKRCVAMVFCSFFNPTRPPSSHIRFCLHTTLMLLPQLRRNADPGATSSTLGQLFMTVIRLLFGHQAAVRHRWRSVLRSKHAPSPIAVRARPIGSTGGLPHITQRTERRLNEGTVELRDEHRQYGTASDYDG